MLGHSFLFSISIQNIQHLSQSIQPCLLQMAYKTILKKPLPFQKRSLLWHNPHLKLPPPITIPKPPTKKMMATTTMLVIVQTLLHFNSQSKGQALLTLKTARTLQNLLYHSKFKARRPLATTTMVVTVEIWAYVLGFVHIMVQQYLQVNQRKNWENAEIVLIEN